MKYFTFFVLLFAFTVSAFGQTEGKAIVYIYSLKAQATLGQVKKPILLDDKEIADIRPAKYFIALLSPGKHTISGKKKKFGGIEMDFEAGKTYYLQFNWSSGAKLTPSGITVSQPESGAFTVKQLQPIDEKNIKDKQIVVLKDY